MSFPMTWFFKSLGKMTDWLEAKLFVRQRSADATRGRKPVKEPQKSTKLSLLTKICAMIAAAGLISSFVGTFYFFATTNERINNDPSVDVLSKPEFPVKVELGNSPPCGADKHECWVSPTFDDSKWKTIGLPAFNIRNLPNYAEWIGRGSIYYRMNLPISEKMRRSPDVASLSLGNVNHNNFEIFLNGRLVYAGNGDNAKNSLTNLSIPKSDMQGSSIPVVVKARLERTDLGIYHYVNLMMGPKNLLDQLYINNERVNLTYFLLLLFAKGSVFIIFALFHLFTKAQRGFVDFLLYAFFVTIENAIIISDEILPLNFRVLFYFQCKTLAIYGLARFFIDHYQIHRVRNKTFYTGFVLLAAVTAVAYDAKWGTRTLSVAHLFLFTNILLVSVLIGAVGIGLISFRMLRRLGVASDFLKQQRGFIVIVALYLVLLIWEAFFNEYKGFDKRAVFDLIFFYYMAFATVRDYGVNEGRIVTLEGHMVEKQRMEAELQEAATISKAFLPASVPPWDKIEIAAFHRPFSESSGDWYTFEKSPSGKLFHFLMCDITGHGVQAAIVVSTCKTVLASMVRNRPELLEREDFLVHCVRELNDMLYSQGGGLHVSTILAVTFIPDQNEILYMAGGHPFPIYLDNGIDKAPKALPSRHNQLGVHKDYQASLLKHKFAHGDELIAYTDGLPLMNNVKTLKTFSAERQGELVQAPKDLYDAVWQAHRKRTDSEPSDDVSVIWFRAA